MRITNVKSARKPQGTCGSCGDEIGVGSAYRWIKPRYGAKRIRCMKPECAFRQSDLTSNDKLATVYSAVEDAQTALGMWGERSPVDDLTSALDDAAEQIRGAGEEWTESAESIREHFTESEAADTAEENAEMAEEFAGQLEEVKDEVEALEPEEGVEPTKPCPSCADQRAATAGERAMYEALPPDEATDVIKARDIKEGMSIVRDPADWSSFLGKYHPMHAVVEITHVVGIKRYQDEEYMTVSAGGAMFYNYEPDRDIRILKENVLWRSKGKSSFEWHWAGGDVIKPSKPPVEIGCIDCDDTGEVALEEDDDWREEAKGLVEGVLQEMPL